MPAALPLIAGAFLAAGSVATAVGLTTAFVVAGLAISWAAVLTITGVALLAVAYLARKTPKPDSGGQQLKQKLDPQSPVPILYGRTATGGFITWRGTWGAKNAFYGIVTVLSAGGPIAGIEAYKAGDYPIGFGASPAYQLATVNNVGGYSGSSKLYKNKLAQRWQNGEAPANTTPGGASGLPIPAGAMSGLAHVITRYEYNNDAFPQGLPSSLWTASGVKLYDPRKDSTYPGGSGAHRLNQPSTWTYSENPFLAALQWTLGRYENGKRVYGIGAQWSEVDVASFVNGANVADANKWKVGGVVTTDDDKYAVLASLLAAGGGVPVARGAQIACTVNAPRTSVLTLTKEDIVGEVESSSTTSWRDRQNTIIPKYREETQGWEIIAGERISSPQYISEDGGEQKTVEIEFPLVQQAAQAHQLATYELCNSREFLTFTVNAKLRLLAVRVGDAITVNVPQIAAGNIKCTITGREFNPSDMSVTLSLKSETDAKHAFALGQSQVAPPAPKLDGYDPSAPGAPAANAWAITATQITKNETTLPVIVVTGAADDPNTSTVIVEYRPTGSTAWLNYGEFPRTTTKVEISGLTDGTAYDVALSYRTVLGVVGERLVLSGTAGAFKVSWSDTVTGNNKPADNADVTGNNTAKDTNAVGGRAVSTVLFQIDKAMQDAVNAANDTVPPEQVTALAASAVLNTANGGADITVSWAASSAADIAGYSLEISENGGGYIAFVTTTTGYKFGGKRGTSYGFKVRAYDKAGNYGIYSAILNWTSITDTVAPAAPTGLTVIPTYEGANVNFTSPADLDLATVRLIVLQGSTEVQRLHISVDPSKTYSTRVGRLAKATAYTVQAYAIDSSGNVSTTFASANFTTVYVAADILDPKLIVPTSVTSLPNPSGYTGSSIVFFSGELYRLMNGAWTKEVPWNDVTGANKAADNATSGDNIVINANLATGTTGYTGLGMTRTDSGAGDPAPFFRGTYNGAGINSVSLAVPAGSSKLFVSWWRRSSGMGRESALAADFFNAAGAVVGNSYAGNFAAVINTWYMASGTLSVPAGAVRMVAKWYVGVEAGGTGDLTLFRISTTEAAATVGAPVGTKVGTMLAEDVVSGLVAITSDNILSQSEKTAFSTTINSLRGDYQSANQVSLSFATAYGNDLTATERTNATTAINALNGFLGGLTPAWDTATVDTPIDGPIARARVQSAIDATTALTVANGKTGGTRAVWNGIVGANKAADNATVGDNMVPDPFMAQGAAKYTLTGANFVARQLAGDPGYGFVNIAFNAAGLVTVNNGLPITVTLGADRRVHFSARVYHSDRVAGWAQAFLDCRDSTGASIGQASAPLIAGVLNQWTTVGAWVTVPAGTVAIVASYDRRTVNNGGNSSTVAVSAIRIATTEPSATLGAPTGTLVGDTPAETVETRANDPATRINQNTVTVDGGKLTARSVDTVHLKAGAVTANEVLAGSLTAAQVATGGLTARVLAVGNGDSVIPDADFRDSTFWFTTNGIPGGVLVPTNASWPAASTNLFQLDGNQMGNAVRSWYSPFFPMEYGATYRIRFYYYADGNFNGWFNPTIHQPSWQWFSLVGGLAYNPDGAGTYSIAGPTGGVITKEFIFTNAGTDAMKQWQFRFDGKFTGGMQMFASIVRVSDTTLIKDGSIVTEKMTVNTIDGDRLRFDSVDAAKVKANTVLTETVIVSGKQLGTVAENAVNSAANTWYCVDDRLYRYAGNKVTKLFSNGWDANAYTRDYFTGGCTISARLPTAGAFFGLSDGRETGNYGIIDYAWHRTSDANDTVSVWINGVSVYNIGTYTNGGGDTVRYSVVYDGKSIRWFRNEFVHYEITTTANRQFAGAVCNYSIGTYVDNLVLTPSADNSLARSDPAKRINEASTKLGPGTVLVAGTTTVADWRGGPDLTQINGGVVSANSISANQLKIGNRGVTNIGLEFEYDTSANGVKWNEGYIYYTDDEGNRITQPVGGGNAFGMTAPRWFVWKPGRNYIEATQVDPGQDNQIVLGSWWGGTRLNINLGGTIINGDRITTKSVKAVQLDVTFLSAIAANMGTITAGKILSNNGQTVLDFDANAFTFSADQFKINVPGTTVAAPFAFQNGQLTLTNVAINGAALKDVTITSSKIAPSAVGQTFFRSTTATIYVPYA
jgi:hypothetical protein